MERNWDILLIGGASGSGKTKIARQLAKIYGVDLVRVDDFQAFAEVSTTPETFPLIHHWKANNWQEAGVDDAVKWLFDVGRAIANDFRNRDCTFGQNQPEAPFAGFW
ncbi:MAG: hypothetical protein FWB98_06755 [Defluviitaleaceae bacterium]|nr:hypothetical protein [Defluviitaleaceae bacterium]